MHTDQGIRELAASIRYERIERARQGHPLSKLWAGPELFDYACSIALSGIRHQHPDADEATVQRMLRERVDLQRKRE